MARKTHHVVPSSGGGWDIKKGGSKRLSDHFDRKTDAIERAREISRNQNTELVIHNRDGRISRADSHGNDPCPPKDKKWFSEGQFKAQRLRHASLECSRERIDMSCQTVIMFHKF